ncbi:SDR family NAD(P)-dependent oxidoreductase [Pedomonas mirosovicensis]|uniref:SDR family NAD(P)-dependent oxidoreductase n=1 Tax=Pedomonas mirosovicensis TaxID=2908641 RepID=UPI002168B5EB|nr:SDR family NAD(P)-dependent oxidoreductase [Pedomonas mirosovicensis]MCH8686195.1 SDR family NAD(P)-dependent oxidoreductase [Pedomonas mirosovicensis]
MRLLCDEMLAGLARWLRAAGHDAVMAEPGVADRDLVRQAREEGRWLLTRDRSLAALGGEVALLLPEPLDAQAAFLSQRLGLDWQEAPFERCLVDNTCLVPAKPEDLAALPAGTEALPGPFRACPACRRIYWPGSHVRRMAARLQRWAALAPSPQGTGPSVAGSQEEPWEIAMAADEIRPLALVTGGSSGIGYALAQEFASHGYDVLIAAENLQHLEEARARLMADGARVKTHASDLAREEGVESLYQALQGRPVDVLCVNAGVGLNGPFVETDLRRELRMIDLNVRGAVQLTKLVLRDMAAREHGKILFTSSIAASHPAPFEAVYGATKVFLRSFGEALRNELKDTGITVTVLMPGVTDTAFFERAEMMDTKAGTMENKDDPAEVAKAAFEALMEGKHKVVPTLKNKVMSAVSDIIPAPAGAQAHRGLAEPGTDKKE